MEELQRAIHPGAMVQARGERWQVRHARAVAEGAIVTLEGTEATNARRVTTLLLPFDRIDVVHDRPPIRRRRQAVIRGLLDAVARARPARGLWAATTARMDLLPWQLAPALSVVAGATRLLLADAVGLGKTLQAGLVLAELRARGLVERALVLAPAAVRGHWAGELRERFGLAATVLDLPAILQFERSGPFGANPWSRAPILVSSIDLVKRPEVCAAVESAPIDFLVVDEAHHATPGTDRHAVVSRLARQVPWVVLASATPHSGDAAAYRSLLDIGDVGLTGERMQVFRRTHEDARFVVRRRTHLLRVRPTAEEAALQHGVLAYAQDLYHSPAGATRGVQLLASLLARRATSSPKAAYLTLSRRLELLAAEGLTPPASTPHLPWEETEDEGAGAWLAWPVLADRAAERECLRRLIARAEAALPAASKITRLQRFVRRLREPVIVFSEFRDTLEACRPALEAVTSVTCLHGELEVAERERRLAMFLGGQAQVLLTTDVAGEGLNLQRAARLVVTVEWPWSPLRLEQRVGRVHRIGQQRVVHAVHLTARGSFEESVVARALQRAAKAAEDLSRTTRRTEQEVASLVLGVGSRGDPTDAAEPGSTDAGSFDAHAVSESTRVSGLRELVVKGHPVATHAVWAEPPRGAGSARAVVVLEVTRHLASGALRALSVVPVAVTLREVPRQRRAWRRLCRRLAADACVRQAALDAPMAVPGGDQWATVRARLNAIREHRHARTSRITQPSLFDRRAIREAEQRHIVQTQWDDWQASTEARLAPGPLVATTRVLAVLPLAALGQ